MTDAAQVVVAAIIGAIVALFMFAVWDMGTALQESKSPVGQYVINPTAPDLTDCGKYWYHTDCQP